jgi:hypothetical protein
MEDPSNAGGAPADDLDLELRAEPSKGEVKKQVEAKPDALPEKYQGKSVEDLIKMHQNAEFALSRQANELGEVRRLADKLIAVKPEADNTRKPERKPITVEALLENPDAALTAALEHSPVAERAAKAEERASQLERQLQANEFTRKYPTFEQDLKNPAFIDWAQKSPLRMRLVGQASRQDFSAASDLWDLWAEHRSLVSKDNMDKANDTASKAATVKTGASQAKGDPIYSRAKLMELRMRAEDGDQAAQAKLNDPVFNARLVQAYADGRVR